MKGVNRSRYAQNSSSSCQHNRPHTSRHVKNNEMDRNYHYIKMGLTAKKRVPQARLTGTAQERATQKARARLTAQKRATH